MTNYNEKFDKVTPDYMGLKGKVIQYFSSKNFHLKGCILFGHYELKGENGKPDVLRVTLKNKEAVVHITLPLDSFEMFSRNGYFNIAQNFGLSTAESEYEEWKERFKDDIVYIFTFKNKNLWKVPE